MTVPAAEITSLDHLVLTVADIDRTVSLYAQALGFEVREFGEGRRALHFGNQKINLHNAGAEIAPHAAHPIAGSADLCFVTTTPPHEIAARLESLGVHVELGPVPRTGATGPITSIYFRDPDGNLIELGSYS